MLNVGNNYQTRAANNQRVETFGRAMRLFVEAFRPSSLRMIDRETFMHYLTVMGLRSVPLIAFGSVFVSMALTTQVVLEAERFKAQDVSGALISVGLLRELGPLTVAMAWAGRTAAFLTETAFAERRRSEKEFSGDFLAPAYLAAIAASFPLAVVGLIVGFTVSALYAPLIGVSSTADFLESARLAIKDKDLMVYFFKSVIINPTVVIFATCLASLTADNPRSSVTATAITWAAVIVFFVNLLCTWAWYLQ